jgi:pyruvate dehydrogenase E1 component alpha subunit
MGHSRTDPGAYRPPGELDRWKERDPIRLFEAELEAGGAATREALAAARETAREAVEAATARALEWPQPEPEDRFRDLWAAPA